MQQRSSTCFQVHFDFLQDVVNGKTTILLESRNAEGATTAAPSGNLNAPINCRPSDKGDFVLINNVSIDYPWQRLTLYSLLKNLADILLAFTNYDTIYPELSSNFIFFELPRTWSPDNNFRFVALNVRMIQQFLNLDRHEGFPAEQLRKS